MPTENLTRPQARRILCFRVLLATFLLSIFLVSLQFPGSWASGISGIHVVSGDNGSAGGDEIRKEFKNPPKSYRPMVRWWWPGGDVNDAEIVREVGLLDEAGFGGAELQAFRFGLKPNLPADQEARVDDFATPSFYRHVSAATKELRRRGMWLDLTFGSGWPFGGGLNITPELASLELRMTRESVHGPTALHQKIQLPVVTQETGAFVRRVIGGSQPMPPGWDERLKSRAKLVAVIAVRGSEPEVKRGPKTLIATSTETILKPGILDPATIQVITEKVAPDGTLDWQVPEGDWQLLTFAESPTDLWILGGVGAYPQLVLDHMKLAAMESHIERIGDSARNYVGSDFGNGIRAIFCDSLEVRAYIYWTDSFLADFRRLRGYDLTPYLPFVPHPGFADPYASFGGPPLYDAPDIAERVRTDYWQTVSDLMDANFYEPFNEWARQNHLLARVQAHGAPADILKIYGQADIPETEQLYGGGQTDFLKMAASAAHVYGHPITSSESFAKAGNPYGTTPEKIKVWADQLLSSGVNEIISHGYPYDYQYPPIPGWYPFQSPLAFTSDLSRYGPFWNYMKPLNQYITRVQYLAQSGPNVAQIAVYRSELSYPARPMPNLEIDDSLTAAGYNFDQFNNDALLKSRVTDRKLVAPSGAAYGALVLNNEHRISLPVAQKIDEFRRQGLPVIFLGAVPDGDAGLKDWEARSKQIQALFQGAAPKASAEEAVLEMRASIPPDLAYEAGSATVPYFHRKVHGLDVFFLTNPKPESQFLNLAFPVQSAPENWDAWTGTIAPEFDFKSTKGGVGMKFELPPYGSRLIVFDPADKHDPRIVTPPETMPTPITIGGNGQTWTLQAGEQRLDVTELKDWLGIQPLKSFSGTGEYQTSFRVDPAWLKRAGRVELDLGEVHDVAQVSLNGKAGPAILMRPYVADVTGLIKAGDNLLTVAVTNTWTNRFLAQGMNLDNSSVPKTQPEPSGLIGPVKLIAKAGTNEKTSR